MKQKLKSLRKALVAGACALAALATSHAIPTLTISDGVNTVVLTDVDGDGLITFAGPFFSWSLNVTTAVTKPLYGSEEKPFMDIAGSAISGVAGGTLTITFSENNFGPTSEAMMASLGGSRASTLGSISMATWVNDANTQVFGSPGTPLTPASALTFTGMGGFSGDAYAALPNNPMTSYTLTEQVVIKHVGAAFTSFDAQLTSVPDGGTTLALLGFALLGLEGMRRKFYQIA